MDVYTFALYVSYIELSTIDIDQTRTAQ